MTSIPRPASIVILAALSALACAGEPETPPGAAQTGELPPGHPPLESSPYAHQGQAAGAGSGPAAVVLEIEEVTDYLYARVEAAGEEMWVAGPKADLAVGDTVALGGAMGMTDFTSAELDRTFESILFLDAWRAPAAVPGDNRGEVLEAIPAASYTYVRVATEDGEVWLAGPRVALEPGQTVTWPQGMVMEDFASNTLERTFDEIWFVESVRVVP